MDDDFQDCVDDVISDSRAFDNTLINVSTPNNDMSIKNKKGNLSTAATKSCIANTTVLQHGNSSDASTQTVSDESVKRGKSSKSSCIIAYFVLGKSRM